MQGNIVIYSLVALTSTAYILPNYEEAFSSKRLCENPSDNELPTYSRSQKVVAATSEKNSSYNKGGARHDEIHLLKQRGQLDGQEDRYSIFTGDRDLFKVRKMFDNSNEERHQSKSYDEKWKNEEEADGIKSYTYYAEGSGPNVVYKRGFYHTETYEDNNRKSRQNKDASRSAYRSSRRHLSNDRQSERRTHSRVRAIYRGLFGSRDDRMISFRVLIGSPTETVRGRSDEC
ncbi:hypothetical protein Q1695_003625 [Nippostrongylus brasiliensis]|nr:hypothetical protein Q1695_003625 [Nippostrongylus brasiliensis]